MPYVWQEPETFLGYQGITIYHAYKDEFSDVPVQYWYSTCGDESPGSPCEFDVRDLPSYDINSDDPSLGPNRDYHKKVIQAAIDAGLIEQDAPLGGEPEWSSI